MATPYDASLGYWTDYNRIWINQPQVLATDFWSRFMTSIVAVCLSLISPYMFRIVKSFLGWFLGLFKSPSRESKPRNLSLTLSSQAAEREALLPRKGVINSGATPTDETLGHSTTREHRRGNGKAYGTLAEPFSNDETTRNYANAQSLRAAQEAAQVTDDIIVGEVSSNPQNNHTHPIPQAMGAGPSHQIESPKGDQDLLNILAGAEGSRDFASKCVRYVIQGSKTNSESIAVIILIILVFLGVFVAWATVGVLSAGIASNRVGLSSSTNCGLWQFDDAAGDEAAYRDALYNRRKEERASEYARNCYNTPDAIDTLSCGIFYNQSIAFESKSQQRCPFPSTELCFDGLYSAVTFDTGYIDASVLGINAPATHKFRRRSTCSPLNMSEPYIRKSRDTNDSSYYYNYGPTSDTDSTFDTSGKPFEWLVPVYSMNAYFASLYPEYDDWQPIPEIRPPSNSTLTIMFISSMHIYHIEPSYDPIFYADEPRYFKGIRKPYYYNSNPRARPLACVDTSELCSPDGKICWNMRSPMPANTPPTFWLMKWSLENSNMYKAIKWRIGAALLAQRKVSQYVSTPLAQNQWELEAGQLFATSLARIQYDTWAIATGEDYDRPGYVEATPKEAKGQLCGIYKFKTLDYTNVSLAAFVGLIVLAIAIWTLSWNVTSKRGIAIATRVWKWKSDSAQERQTPSKLLVIDVFVVLLLTAISRALYFLLVFPFMKLKNWREGGNNAP